MLDLVVAAHRAETHGFAVGQECIDGEDVVAHRTVDDGVGTAAVVSGHTAKGGLARGRYVYRELKAMGGKCAVESVHDEARLHLDLHGFGIEVNDLVQVATDIDDQRFTYGLSALR